MRILVSAVGRDSHPTGICRVAASHVKALLSEQVATSIVLVIGHWQRDLFAMILGPSIDDIEVLIADAENTSISRNYWYAIKLPRLAQAHRADIIHLTFPAPTRRKAFGSPVVVTLHDLYPYDIPENFGFPQYLANRAILRQCLSAVDGVACVSNSTRSRLEEIFPKTSRRSPVMATGNYVEVSSDTPIRPSSLNDLKPGTFVLTVAQHRKNKNLALLLRSFAELAHPLGFDGQLVVVGSNGSETAALHQLSTELGIKPRVHFCQSISDAELRWLYANCSIFVVCSSIEGYCLPLVEALGNQARVVCSDIAIFREIGGDTCIYFSLAEDATANLVNAMNQCLRAPRPDFDPHYPSRQTTVLAEYLKLYSLVCPSSDRSVTAKEPAVIAVGRTELS